jgi:hypothetical protein
MNDIQMTGFLDSAVRDNNQRTAGRIGSLARLIRQAAITAICDGTERITKKALEAIQLDHLAEEASRPRTRQPARTA